MFDLAKARKLKKDQGRQTKWLAEQCGVEPNTMTLYFSGTRTPSLSVVKHMARVFNVPEAELWTQNPAPKQIAS